jgi:beta-lactamase superfamily II metal-dependent hydrolase
VDLLKEKADSKVDAWFFTHPHQDHIGAFYYASQFADIDVRKIYYNFPSVEEVVKNQRSPDEPDMWKNVSPLFEDKYKAQTQVIEKNEIFTFDDVKVKVLRVYNPQLVNNNFLNESSAVYRMYNDTSSFLILGDLGTDGGAEVMKNCALADLQTEYTQMAHHGQNGVTKEFYAEVAPEVCIWHAPKWLWDNDAGKGFNTHCFRTVEVRQWMDEIGTVKKNIVDMDGTQVYEL